MPQGENDEQDQPQGEPQDEGQGTPPPQGDDEIAKVKAESRKWEARAKKDAQALADLRKQVGNLLSPEQVADKDAEIARLKAEADAKDLIATKYRVAAEAGLPIEWADRLRGDDEDALKADAEIIKGSLNLKAPASTKDAKKGSNGTTPPVKPDPNELLRRIVTG